MQQTQMPSTFFDVDAARHAGYSDTEIANHLSQLHSFDIETARKNGYKDSDIVDYLQGKPFSAEANVDNGGIAPPQKPPVVESPWDFGNILRSVISGGVGVGTGIATANPLAGSAAMAGTDYLLRKATGKPEEAPFYGQITPDQIQSPLGRAALDIGSNTLFNEGVGKVIDLLPKSILAALSAVKEYRNPGSVVGEIEGLKPTYSQYAKTADIAAPNAAKFIEDIFARKSKEAALDTSASLAHGETQRFTQGLTGDRVKITTEDLAGRMQQQAKQDLADALTASNGFANNLKAIADTNTRTVSVPQSPSVTPNLNDPYGNKIVTQQPPIQKTIAGPIDLNETANKLIELKNKIATSLDKPEPNNPVIRSVDTILNAIGYKNENGVVSLTDSTVPFNVAWATKKDLGQKAFENGSELPDYVKKAYKEIYHAIDTDIDNGIQNWDNGKKDAIQNWNSLKENTHKTYENFFPDREEGKSTKHLLNTVNTPDPTLDSIAEDKNRLQRFFNTGESTLSDGTVVTSSNKRKDMQGYKFMSLFNDAWKPLDPNEIASGQTNAKKLVTNVTNYLNSDAGKLLYSADQRKTIGDFVNNVASTSDSLGPKSRYFTLKNGAAAATISGGLLSHIVGGTALSGGVVGSGLVLGGSIGLHSVGKILTNPEAARLLVAAQSGAPLGMSVKMASRIIGNALRGEVISLQLQDGGTITGKIDSNGQVTTNTGNEIKLKGQNQ